MRGSAADQLRALKALHRLGPADRLDAIDELAGRGLLPALLAAAERSGVRQKALPLCVALQAAYLRGQMPPLDFLRQFGSELSALSERERGVVRAYVSQRVTPLYSLSPQGLELILAVEFPRQTGAFTLFEDQSHNCTIGYGHLVHPQGGPCDGSEPEEFKRGITQARALELARGRMVGYVAHLNQEVRVELNRWQADALIDFIYNAGGLHELKDPINEGRYEDIPDLLLRTRPRGKSGADLTPRRRVERALFARGDYNWRATKDTG
jgi:GH24 family phage-related lysozyme (muramidase)